MVMVCLLVFSGIVSAQGNSANAFERVKEVQERHTDRLMEQDGVVGTAIGLDEKGGNAVFVLLERPGIPGIPADLEGVPVRPVVTGKVYALPKPPTPSAKPTKPAAPTNLTAIAISSSQINLSWTDNATNETGFRIERKTTGGFSQIATVGANVTTYSNTGLNSSTTYTYWVCAYNSAGTSAYSNVASATTLPGEVSPYPRPARIGISTGHPNITAGTIGCRVTKNGLVYALSNNHVYADENRASIDDNVLQPGPYDGGQNPRDAIGTLADFQPIVFSRRANNTIDAAIALCTTATLDNRTPDGSYGTPSNTTVPASVNLAVKKQGRTTGLTHGFVYAVNATVNVGYDSGTARFINQIVITPGTFSAGGDSGSLIVTDDENNYPVGLLFAGSSSYTIANPIGLVLSRFGVAIDGL